MLFIEPANDRIAIYDYDGVTDYGKHYNVQIRDPSAWYHVQYAVDTTQSTASDRLKTYLNGTQLTAPYATEYGDMPLNYETEMNYTTTQYIGKYVGNAKYADGYLSDVNFVDGTQLAPTSFGETKNGVWIPKKYTGSYGTNGYRLQFIGTGTSTSSGSVTNPTNIGDDSSGNNNHFAVSGLASTDANIPDSPENNFCTWNPLSNTGVTLANGNLETSGGASHVCGGTMAVTSGKWYWECKLKSTVNGSNPVILSFVSANTIAHAANYEQGVYFYTDNGGNKSLVHVENNSATQTITVPSAMLPIAVDEVMQYAYDGDTGKIWFGIENVWADNSGGTTGNPSTGANPTFTLADTSIFMTPLRDHGGVAWTGHANFGQLTNAYTAPTDFNALSTANLEEPTISPDSSNGTADDYHNTVLYTGDGQSGQAITGIGFKPDWVWIKERSSTSSNALYDSSRGIKKQLESNTLDAETNYDSNLLSFDIDGFTLGGSGATNQSSQTYVGWNWKANAGTTSTNEQGNVTTTVQANTTAGFSICTYSGNSSALTIGHGLGKKPAMVIVKNRTDSSTDWIIGHKDLSSGGGGFDNNKFLKFSTASTLTNSLVFGTEPTTTTIALTTGNAGNLSTSGKNYVAYCFAEVEGYSRFSSYTGNGSNDGTFVFLGFRPSFIMTKRTNSTSNWVIQDSVRQTFNPSDAWLRPNTSDSEGTTSPDLDIDFLSNGFKVRNNGTDNNISGSTYIYMAFGSSFKYANAR